MSDLTPVQNNFSSDAVQYAKKASYYAPSTGGGAGGAGVTQIVVDAVDLTGSVTLEGQNGVTVTQNGSGTITIDGTLGGVTSIVAGTGVTISPTSGLGAVTVNATASIAPGFSVGYMGGIIAGSSVGLTFTGGTASGTNSDLLTQLEIGKAYTGVICVRIPGFANAATGTVPSGLQPNQWVITCGAGSSGGGSRVVYRPTVVGVNPNWSADVTVTINPIKGVVDQPTPEPFTNLNLVVTCTPQYNNGAGGVQNFTNFVTDTVGFQAFVSGFFVECNSAVATI